MAFSKLVVLVFLNCLLALPSTLALNIVSTPCLLVTTITISITSPVSITPPAGISITPGTTVTVKFKAFKAMHIPDANIQVGAILAPGTLLSSSAEPIYKSICIDGISICQDTASFWVTLKLPIPSDAIGPQVLRIAFKNTATGSFVGCAKVNFPVTPF